MMLFISYYIKLLTFFFFWHTGALRTWLRQQECRGPQKCEDTWKHSRPVGLTRRFAPSRRWQRTGGDYGMRSPMKLQPAVCTLYVLSAC